MAEDGQQGGVRPEPFPELLAGRPGRRFCDAKGRWWRVYERHVDAVKHPSQHTTLVFESLACIRRVHNYPVHWESLSELELEQLSWRR